MGAGAPRPTAAHGRGSRPPAETPADAPAVRSGGGRAALRAPACAEPYDAAAARQSVHLATTGARDRLLEGALVCVRDPAGRPRGTGFAADHRGTVITSHEAVDGLTRLVLHTPGADDRSCVVTSAAVTPLPGLGLALVRTEGLDVPPLPVSVRGRVRPGQYVRFPAGGWREARVLGTTAVTYSAADRCHLLPGVLELAIGTAGRDALRPGGGAAGGPVLDLETGAVVGVLGTALRSGTGGAGFAVPLPCDDGPLTELLARNAATVPAYGPDLNVAGVLELTATSVAQDAPRGALPDHAPAPATVLAGPGGASMGSEAVPGGPATVLAGSATVLTGPVTAVSGPPAAGPDPVTVRPGPASGRTRGPVERAYVLRELEAFGHGPAAVLGLVGAPGSGRTTELAALAGRRARGDAPAPTLWLRGADLEGADASVADAAARALDRAARIVSAARAPLPTDLTDLTPERVARLARAHGRPLLVLLDGPEEMPAVLARRLAEWTGATARWLRATGARLVVACRDEYWEGAGALFPPDLLHLPTGPEAGGRAGEPGPAEHAGRLREAPGTQGTGGAERNGGAAGIEGAEGHGGAGGTTGAQGPEYAEGTGGRLGPECAEGITGTQGPECAEGIGGSGGVGGAEGREDAEGAEEAEGRACLPGLPPPCLLLGDLRPEEAREARARYGVPDGALAEADARHPLTLRLLAEVRAALPGTGGHPRLDRTDVLAAHLDLMCLRVAVRLAAENDLRGTAVRRLAARVSGQVHEAARRSLGPGPGGLDRATFEEVFPWGPAPARLGGGTGWASAVLTEGLLVPAGDGYRFAHEELADWIQGAHLDLDEALRVLVHRRHVPGEPRRPRPVPHHRIGPVVQALLLLARHHGTRRLAVRLEELLCALDGDPHSWWASRLLAAVLLRVPDATPYAGVLRLLADRLGVWRECGLPVPGGFGPAFWTALHLPVTDRCDLLRRLLVADDPTREPPDSPGTPLTRAEAAAPAVPPLRTRARASRAPRPPRYLDALARLLTADPAAVGPHLTRWFDDERPLPAAPRATVATAAQALLYAHRHRAPDDLADTLADCAHPRAAELLTALAEEEPSALCRAVDRWARDERQDRRTTAVEQGLRTAPHARTRTDRELLCRAALAVLARPADTALHGRALALLVADPAARARHLPQALRHFATGDAQLPPSALAPALATHPETVLTAFGERLRHGPDAGETLRTLTEVTTPALARRVAAVVREAVARRPDTAEAVAACVDRRLCLGPDARSVLFPLVSGLLESGCPAALRSALGGMLVAPGLPASRALRRELLDLLLAHESDPAVLDAVLRAAAPNADEDLGHLVHRVGLLLVRTPEGAAVFDRALVELARHVPGFAARVAGWLTGAPYDWAAVVGPSARRAIENLAGAVVPV
ncbi:trypsin-like peptidase domain-containing protein [Streptomyces sp. NPDC056160]|uniref:trypsin-like peptidase domain-containing protein n=1 Tax=Streptomyces sp. NPDC056160 TaxID=3345731 RepID=UPI0035DF7763